MIRNPFDDFVSAWSTPFFVEADKDDEIGQLLWGDGVEIVSGTSRNGRVNVRARGRKKIGWVKKDALGGKSLLEFYFIDVGQGDGVLVKTPEFRHLMIDGGYKRASQPTKKNAADFVDWKFYHDYKLDRIELDAMIASHNDADHYGGLSDLLDVAQNQELDAKKVSVEAFYHAGISWWTIAGKRSLGEPVTKDKVNYFVRLLEGRTAAKTALDGQSQPQLQGEWATLISRVVNAKKKDGSPTPIVRVSNKTGHLPTFESGEPVSISILGPVEFTVGGKPALLKLGAVSKTTNGNSILMRVDYGNARILLTGDLNKVSQRALLTAHEGNRLAFQCDVAKACHHGSDDVSFEFLQAVKAAATIISSGDGEGHDHPRPAVVAASAVSGFLTFDKDEMLTPLVYSTELARSVQVAHPTSISIPRTGGQPIVSEGSEFQGATVNYSYYKPGALNPERKQKDVKDLLVVADLIYGLVNIRTDGTTILAATMNEEDATWSIKTFKSRF